MAMLSGRHFVAARQIRNLDVIFIEYDDTRVGNVDVGIKAFRSASLDGHAHQGMTLYQSALRPAIGISVDVYIGRRHDLAVGFHTARHGRDGDAARCDGQCAVYKADPADKGIIHHPVRIRECQRFQPFGLRIICKRERLDLVRRRVVTRLGDAALDRHVQGPHAVLIVQRKDRLTGAPAAVGQGRTVICLLIRSSCNREFGYCVIVHGDDRFGFLFFFRPLQYNSGVAVDKDSAVFDVGFCPVRADGNDGGVIFIRPFLYGDLGVISEIGNAVQCSRCHIIRPALLKWIWDIKALRGKADLRILLGNPAAGDFQHISVGSADT